ncbi:MAG: DoxX family protein [Methanococcaceae archaeon]
MKKSLIYWTSTGVFSMMMLFAGYNYLTNPQMKAAFQHLGFPDYFRIELAVSKLLGAIVLLIPLRWKGIKYFGYAGFTIVLISAAIAHLSSGDPLSVVIMPVTFFAILVISFVSYNQKEAKDLESDSLSINQSELKELWHH